MAEAHQTDAQIRHPTRNSAVSAADAPPPQRLRFTIADLFALLTWSSLAAFVASLRGLGTLVPSAGVVLAWLNWKGCFGWAQTRRRRPRLVTLAWLLFAVSMFLPAVPGCGPKPIYGWGAAWIVATAPAEAVVETARGEHRDEPLQDWLASFTLLTMINVANLSLLLAPLLAWRLHAGKGRMLAACYAVCVPGIWMLGSSGPFLIGFHVWFAAHTLLFLAIPVGRRTWWTMFAMWAVFLLLGFPDM